MVSFAFPAQCAPRFVYRLTQQLSPPVSLLLRGEVERTEDPAPDMDIFFFNQLI